VSPDAHDTCWTVLRAASSGDAGARSMFARSYAGLIRAYLKHRWRDRPVAAHVDDAIQDTFVECYKPGGVLERAKPGRGDFRALLYGVIRNVARRYEERTAKSIHRAPGESVYLDELPHQADALSRLFERSWAQSLLREAVEQHRTASENGDPEANRRFRILRMRHDDGLPVREIAATLGEADVARVHNDYRRARREFAVHLRAVVGKHTGAEGDDIDIECRRLTALLGS
jgi:RNA polymerase sigma factor (sigma-70 family)